MGYTTLKIQCKTADLANAMEKYGDVKNVVIENGGDVEGIINCLIEIIGDDTYYAGEERPCSGRVEVNDCKVEEDRVIVTLEAADEDYREEFIICVKKLQNLISSAKEGV